MACKKCKLLPAVVDCVAEFWIAVALEVDVVDNVVDVLVTVVVPAVTMFPNIIGAGWNPPFTVTIASATISGDATDDIDIVSYRYLGSFVSPSNKNMI